MMAMAAGLLKSWKMIALVASVVALLGAGWGVRSYMAEHERLKREVAMLAQTNEHNVAALQEIETRNRVTTKALERAMAEVAARNAELNQIRGEIANAPDEDDGPVAPVLGRTLERLRGDPGDGGQDRDGQD